MEETGKALNGIAEGNLDAHCYRCAGTRIQPCPGNTGSCVFSGWGGSYL